jgi:hypothetical protein
MGAYVRPLSVIYMGGVSVERRRRTHAGRPRVFHFFESRL